MNFGRISCFKVLVVVFSISFAQAEEEHSLTFEQRTAVNAIKLMGGSVRANFGKDERLFQLSLPKGFADGHWKTIEPLLDQPISNIELRRHALSPEKLRLLGKSLAKLQSLQLIEHDVSEEQLKAFGEYPKLGFLNVRDCQLETQAFTIQGLFSELCRINLQNVQWQAKDFARLEQLPKLESITVWGGNNYDQARFEALRKLPHLQSLIFENVEVDRTAWNVLAKVRSLRELNIQRIPIEPVELAQFQGAPFVNFSFHAENFKNIAELAPLLSMKRLEWLNISIDTLDATALMELERQINEPRLRDNFKKGHLAGYPITNQQREKLGLQQPVRIISAKYVTGEPPSKDHWYPPAWLDAEWKKQKDDPQSDKINDWFPSDEKSLIDLIQ